MNIYKLSSCSPRSVALNSLLYVGGLMLFAFVAAAPVRCFADSPPVGRNIKASDFMNTFGVNIHIGDNNYRNLQAVTDALNIIGFSRVRCACQSPADVAAWKDLAAKASPYFPAGMKADVLVTGYMNAPGVTLASQEALLPQLSGILESIEGPNEINNYAVGSGTHGPSDYLDTTGFYPSNYLTWAKALAGWKSQTKSMSHVMLIAPSIASGLPEEYAKLPNVSNYVDAGNMHFYAGGGRQPSGFGGGNFSAIYDWYKTSAIPNGPVTVTEWGQNTAGRQGQGGCDEAAQAKYVLNQMCDIVAKGATRAYIYQLMDDTSDGDPTGNGGMESHFGLFDYNWRVKPAAQALANLKNLLADKTSNFTAQPPQYTVSGITDAGAAGSDISISKSDGSTYIVVWNEPKIWDASTNTAVIPANDAVTVSFGGNYTYQVFDPISGMASIASGAGRQAIVTLKGSPIMIRVTPAR